LAIGGDVAFWKRPAMGDEQAIGKSIAQALREVRRMGNLVGGRYPTFLFLEFALEFKDLRHESVRLL
jgi:hypothetical protein